MAFVLAMLLFSMAGIPPLAGFFAKFYVFAAAMKAGLYALAVIGVLASVVAAYYYLRLVKIMFFDDARQAYLPVDRWAGIVMAVTGAFVVLFVLVPAPLVDAALTAARSLQTAAAQAAR
jgi:NADH-quinone oxidoreductase subunit N